MMMSSVKFTMIGFLFVFVSSMVDEADEYDYNAADNYVDYRTPQANKGDIYEDVLEEDLALEEEIEPRSSRAPATCFPVESLSKRVIEHPLGDCCANNMCDEGDLCRSFTYALKCYPASLLPDIFPALCNDEPVEGFCKPSLVEQTRQPQTCLQGSELGEALDIIINNPNTNCLQNNDCKVRGFEDAKCRFFSSNFFACDAKGNFEGVYQPLCEFPTK
mmetsp:Transcript_25802/g.29503  ORF Transcript_25802/g.29503 Transcript_25802/m.29503 type:complete len:218 (-) Transcript_25802:84-737(-)